MKTQRHQADGWGGSSASAELIVIVIPDMGYNNSTRWRHTKEGLRSLDDKVDGNTLFLSPNLLTESS